MTRYANPYFVRATIEFVGMTCYDAGDVKTIVKAELENPLAVLERNPLTSGFLFVFWIVYILWRA